MRKRERERERGSVDYSRLFFTSLRSPGSLDALFLCAPLVSVSRCFSRLQLCFTPPLSLSLLLTFPPLACSPAFCLVGLMQCARARLFRVSCSAAIACVCVGIMRRAYLDWLGGWGSAGTKGWDDKIKEWVEFFSAEVKVKGNFEQ